MEAPSTLNEFIAAISPMARQLDRLEERRRDIVTRSDLEALRKELVARDSLDPQLNALSNQIARVDRDRVEDKIEFDKRLDKMEQEQLSRQDRLWMRLGQGIAIAAFALSLFEFLSHMKFIP
jgi:hypothetical protein